MLTSGGGSSDLLNQLIAQLDKGSQDANNASLSQYQNLLNSVSNTTNSILGKHGLLNTAGQTAIADTKENTQNQVGAANQNLISEGLGNSTIRPNVLTGIQNRGQRELNAINENVAGQKAGMTLDLGKLNADSILSRQNQSPDMSMYLKLIQQLAATQTGQQKMFSNAGSVNSVNGGANSALSSSIPTGGNAPLANQAGGYYSNANNPALLSSPLAYRPGDTMFGSSQGDTFFGGI